MGVTKTGETYRARYTIKGVRKNVGTFKTKAAATKALILAKANDRAVTPDLFEDKIRGNYLESPIPKAVYNPSKPKFKERVKIIWGNLKRSLENKGLL